MKPCWSEILKKITIEDLDLQNAKIRIQKTGITNERILDLKTEQILSKGDIEKYYANPVEESAQRQPYFLIGF
jgi:hypothetical protein